MRSATTDRRAARPVGPTWRDDVTSASGLNVLVAVWLIGSPFALDYGEGDSIWNPLVAGAVVAIIAWVRFSGAHRQSWLSGVNVLVGGWLFVAGPWFAESTAATWNSVISGLVVAVLAMWSMLASAEGEARERERRRRRRRDRTAP